MVSTVRERKIGNFEIKIVNVPGNTMVGECYMSDEVPLCGTLGVVNGKCHASAK